MAGLDRTDICAAVESLLESDSTLYGATGLINNITDNYVDYKKARITVNAPYKMFLKAPRRELIDTRMCNNDDYVITVIYRVEGMTKDPNTAQQKIDDIDDRIQHLISNEMWSGGQMSSHYSNDESQIINMEWVESECDTTIVNDKWRIESEGQIRVEINRIKP